MKKKSKADNEDGSVIIIGLISIVVVSIAALAVFQSASQAMHTAQLNWYDCQTSLIALSTVHEEINSIDDKFIDHYNEGAYAKQVSKFDWFHDINHGNQTVGASDAIAENIYHFGEAKGFSVPNLSEDFRKIAECIEYTPYVESLDISVEDQEQMELSTSTEKLIVSIRAAYVNSDDKSVIYENNRFGNGDTKYGGTVRAFTSFGAALSDVYNNVIFGNNKVWFNGKWMTINGAVRSNANIIVDQNDPYINAGYEKVVASKPVGDQLLMVSGGFGSEPITGSITEKTLGQSSNYATLGLEMGSEVYRFRQLTDAQYNDQAVSEDTSSSAVESWSGFKLYNSQGNDSKNSTRPYLNKVPLKNTFD